MDEGESLLLKGEIVPGDFEHLLKVIGSDEDRFWGSGGFVLASQGGDLQEALKIARLVKGTYKMVSVGQATGPCVSACFFIFAASAQRLAEDHTLGVHRPYVHPRRLASMSLRDAETLQKNVFRQARTFLEDLGVPNNLIDNMFQRSSTEVYWLSRNETEEQLGTRPPWYEQFLIGRCGFDKTLERKYFSTNDKSILDKLMSIQACGSLLARPEAQAFLNSELKKSRKR
jgi:hypothetical protein